jgi:exodeoxyribonuclease VII large subunit
MEVSLVSVPAQNPASVQILTVSQVTRELRNLLEGTYPRVWIEGEISNLRVVHSGHAYFTLKDAHSQLRSVMFRSSWRQLPFTPEAGMHVVAQGRLSVYEPRGDYQLLASTLEPKGIGALQLAYEQLRDRLFQEGLFDEARKRPLPLVPQRIGIVTSPTGAAIRDIVQIVHRRRANVHLYLCPVRVQGQEASQEIVAAIAKLNAFKPRPEVLIVGRGGGSLEDLWSFNEEQVARAIAASEIPVISAVGHEIDYTIADFVADLRAPTPSAAAELVVKSEEELRQQLNALVARMHTVVQYRHAQAEQALDYLLHSRPLREPHRFVETLQQQVDDLVLQLEKGWQNNSLERLRCLQQATRSLTRLNPRVRWQRLYTHLTALERRLYHAAQSRLERRGENLAGLSSRLQALSPLAVLGRGYSLCRDPISRQIMPRAALAHPGQQIEVLLQDGRLTCTVDDIDAKEPDYGRPDLRTGIEAPGGNR